MKKKKLKKLLENQRLLAYDQNQLLSSRLKIRAASGVLLDATFHELAMRARLRRDTLKNPHIDYFDAFEFIIEAPLHGYIKFLGVELSTCSLDSEYPFGSPFTLPSDSSSSDQSPEPEQSP